MSGNKRATVSISQDEYDRLRESEIKLRELPPPAQDATQSINQQSMQILKTNLDEVQRRQTRFHDFLEQVDGVVQDLERNTSSRLAEIETRAFGEMESQIGSLRYDLGRVLEEQQQRYENYVLSLHQQQQAELVFQAVQIDQVYQDISQRHAIAASWFEHFLNLFNFIRTNYAVEFFFPGLITRYEQQLAQVENNIANGFYDAVLVASQQAFQELSEMRLELEAKHTEWHFLYLAVWEGVNQEISQVENSFYVPAFDLDGNELSYLVDIDFWEPGQLDQLHFELSEIGNQLLDQENIPDISTLKNWLSREIPEIHQKIVNAIIDARIKTINSQLRINVADLVVQALEEQGFALSSCAFNDYDQRQGYGARLTNLEGNEVIVQVSPTGETVGENTLQIQSLDSEDRTEHELERRWQEINQSLRSYGVDVGGYERLHVPKHSHQRRSPIREKRNPLKLTQKSG